MTNRLCKALEIRKPVIQGPMAWVATAPLVAAVSNAGGLGVLGVGFAPADYIRNQILETRKRTDQPFAVNTIMIPENVANMESIVREMHPPVIYADTIAGLDPQLCSEAFDFWHEQGAKVIVKASFLEDAQIAEEAGADVLILKGWEGGGHVTFETTMILVPQAKDQLSVPIVASGGIADGRGMAAAIALGADGIEMGTVFMAVQEGTIHPNVVNEILQARDMSTVITGYSTDEPCRQLYNQLAEQMIQIEAQHPKEKAAKLLREAASSSLRKAMLEGDLNEGAVMAGQIVPLVNEIRTVQDVIDSVLEGAKSRLLEVSEFSLELKGE